MIVGALAYASLVLVRRVSGTRTLSAMSAFDLVLTVALGSTLATVILAKDMALAQGVAAFVVLAGLQFIITRLAGRAETVAHGVKAERTLLCFRGRFLSEPMSRMRARTADVLAAVRHQGSGAPATVEAVILATDGSISVIQRSGAGATAFGDRAGDGPASDAAGVAR